MTLMMLLPVDVETVTPRQTRAVPKIHRAAAAGSMGPMTINTSSIAHVRLTVTDIERSRQFYESVFGWPVLIESPESADAATREALGFLFGGVIYDLGGTLVGLRPVASDRFHEDRCGLDHLAFRVASKAELDDAAAHLDELGVEHEPIKDIGPSFILEFRDPDNIALELTAPK
jgi:glyoxylase I family protein